MAVVTGTRGYISTPAGPCVLSVTFDDADGSLIGWELDTPVVATVTVLRTNGQGWWTATVEPGRHTRGPQGPVRNIADVPDIRLAAGRG